MLLIESMGKTKQTQIPCGNDSQKSNDNNKDKRRFPAGVTAREASAHRCSIMLLIESMGKTKQTQIPCGNDSQKSDDNNKDERRFPAGMTAREASAHSVFHHAAD